MCTGNFNKSTFLRTKCFLEELRRSSKVATQTENTGAPCPLSILSITPHFMEKIMGPKKYYIT